MWMTTDQIKAFNNITVTDYDTRIDLFNPIAEKRVNSYIRKTYDTVPNGYDYIYARLVWLMIEGSDYKSSGKNITSQSFDGESIGYGDNSKNGNASTIDEAIAKFKPLRARCY